MPSVRNILDTIKTVAGDKAPALNDFFKSNGGISGLADKFQNGGAGELFASWVSTGKNEPITSEQISEVLGNSQLQEIATKFGIDTTAATTFIATNLPVLIDKLTPDGIDTNLDGMDGIDDIDGIATNLPSIRNILDSITAVAGDKAPALNDFFKSNGGIAGLADKFQNGGAGELFASWVGTGNNQPITSEQISEVLGKSQLQVIATKLGIDTTAATTFIATNLPVLIDKLTPDGVVETNPTALPPTA